MEDRNINIPEPILDDNEYLSFLDLKNQFEKLTAPDPVQELGKKLVGRVPDAIKNTGSKVIDVISGLDFTQKCLEIIKTGYNVLESKANSLTVSENEVIAYADSCTEENDILTLEDICLARSYDLDKGVQRYKAQNLGYAAVEGTITGAIGMAGIPFSLVLTTFMYYRAVQSVAMFYGYDVKNNPDELVIAGDVFVKSLNPKGSTFDEMSRVVDKIMNMTETTVVRKVASKSWSEMANHGGVTLFATQLHALADSAAQQALEEAGKKSLEGSIFEKIFSQVGKELSQKFIRKSAPVVGSIIGIACDSGDMNKVINYANIFYHKRFILEKKDRIQKLTGNSEIDQ